MSVHRSGRKRKSPKRVAAGKRGWRTYARRHPKAKRVRRWRSGQIERAFSKNKGALHRMLGVPKGERIPVALLRAAVRRGGLLARRAQLVLNMRAGRRKRMVKEGRRLYREGGHHTPMRKMSLKEARRLYRILEECGTRF